MPAWSTAGNAVAAPFANPWFVTIVSARSATGVRPPRYSPMASGAICSTEAKALARSGVACRNVAIAALSHALPRVPP